MSLAFIAGTTAAFAAGNGERGVKRGSVTRDIPYSPTNGFYGLGDLYLPGASAGQTMDAPLALVIHGGGWVALDRKSIAGVAEFLCRDLGFAVFNIEYRLASASNPFPACADDCLAAARFLLSDDFRARHGLRHREIWLVGASAGGHLALWTLVNLPPDSVAGVISISSIGGPFQDFAAHPERYKRFLGEKVDAEDLAAMDPIPLIRPGMAPVLCTHADADKVVPIASHRAFADAYRAVGNPCEFFEYRHDAEPNEGGHFIWRPGSNPRRLLAVLETRITNFVSTISKP
jgi:acetyl esterase/lipase